MTLDKHAVRCMLEEFFTDYGPHQRFDLDMSHGYMNITVVERRGHPLKTGQERLGGL